ncbi:MAG: ABC transporter substrate-binding protein [Verrucomicrobiota bacterium]
MKQIREAGASVAATLTHAAVACRVGLCGFACGFALLPGVRFLTFVPMRFVSLHLLIGALATLALQADSRVVIISPHNESIRTEFSRAFAEWHRTNFGESVTLEWREIGGTSDSLRFVQSEFSKKPDGIGIDCFFGGGSEPFLLLADKKLTHAHKPSPEILSGIPQSFSGIEVYDKHFAWFGAALSSFGILQSTRVQRLAGLPFVQRWEELTDPKLFGWVGAGDPRNSGTMTVMYEAILQAYGWEKGWQILTELAGNVRKFDRVSSTTAKDVTLGETAYALAIDFYGFTQVAVAGRTNLTFVLPRDFTAISPDGICILKGAPNLVLATRLVDFVLSESGQKLWFLPKGHPEGPQKNSIERMSVRPDFYARFKGVSNIEFSPFDIEQTFIYNSRLARERREILPALIGALLIDTHDELIDAWRAVIDRGAKAADRAALGQTPISESETMNLARESWKDAGVRVHRRIAWQTWAQEKYRRLTRSSSARSNPPSIGAARN